MLQTKVMQKMTNYERIKAMTLDEMAEFLHEIFDCNDCSEHQRLSDNPLLKDEKCDGRCKQHCRELLMKEI